jgi:predicted nucleic acid-binding protein
MKIVDVNLLIYAVNRDSPLHKKAKVWLEKSLVEVEPLGFCWVVILAFLRLTTKPGLFQKPFTPERAFNGCGGDTRETPVRLRTRRRSGGFELRSGSIEYL